MRARPTSTGASSSSVRSGSSPRWTPARRHSRNRRSTPRPPPWYANVASVKRSQTTQSPRSRAGTITRARCCARAANIRSASASGTIGSSCSPFSRSSRSRSPKSVPPGSRVSSVRTPLDPRRRSIAARLDVLPTPSMPSIVMNAPRTAAPSVTRLVQPFEVAADGAIVLLERRGEVVAAVRLPGGDEIERVALLRVDGRLDRRRAGERDRGRRQAEARIRVVRRVPLEVAAANVAVVRVAEAVDDGRIRLQAHAALQAPHEHPRDRAPFPVERGLLLDDGRENQRLVRRADRDVLGPPRPGV